MQKKQWQISFAAVRCRCATLLIVAATFALLNGCATIIPDIEAVSPVQDLPGVAALGQNSNSAAHRRLSIDDWIDFLYAQPERPDPHHAGKTLPAKGPAVCASSIDWARNETAIAQLCIHGKCTYEQKQALDRAMAFRRAVKRANQFTMQAQPFQLEEIQ